MLTPFILNNRCPVSGCKFGSFNVSHLRDKEKQGGAHLDWRKKNPMAVSFLQGPSGVKLQRELMGKAEKLRSEQAEVDRQLQAQQSKAKREIQREKDGSLASAQMEKELKLMEQRVKEEVQAKKLAAAKEEMALQREREDVRHTIARQKHQNKGKPGGGPTSAGGRRSPRARRGEAAGARTSRDPRIQPAGRRRSAATGRTHNGHSHG